MFGRGRKLGIGFLFLMLVASAATTAFAKGGDVEFHGTLTRIDNTSTPSIKLRISGVEVQVKVATDAEVVFHGDEIGLANLRVGDFVKVIGFFANSGITAREIVVIDQGDGEFRFRGRTSAVRSTPDGPVITVLGVDILVDSDTKIQRRGPDGGFTPSNLTADLSVDVSGIHSDGKFIATRLKVGNREEDLIRVQFNGKIASLGTGSINVDTEGGGVAVVLIDSDTKVIGTPAAGMFVDVRGTLNSTLQVVASQIIVKASRDADDPQPQGRPPSTKFDKRITISPVGSSNIRGTAHVSLDEKSGDVEQEIEVDFERAQGNTAHSIRVEVAGAPITLGTTQTNSGGHAKFKLKLPTSGAPLPSGKTVRDITKVQILSGSTVLAEGAF
jgi:hypothetical protein